MKYFCVLSGEKNERNKDAVQQGLTTRFEERI